MKLTDRKGVYDTLSNRWTGKNATAFREYEQYPATLPTGKKRQSLGRIDSLTYRRDEDRKEYVHEFDMGPFLIRDRESGIFYLDGGAYQVTSGWLVNSTKEKKSHRSIPKVILQVGEVKRISTTREILHFGKRARNGSYMLVIDRYNRAHIVRKAW